MLNIILIIIVSIIVIMALIALIYYDDWFSGPDKEFRPKKYKCTWCLKITQYKYRPVSEYREKKVYKTLCKSHKKSLQRLFPNEKIIIDLSKMIKDHTKRYKKRNYIG